jgi:hypothetical protein
MEDVMTAVKAIALLGALTLGACNAREETGRAVEAADTVVTTRQEMDTAIITHDTTVDVDTTRKEGESPVSRDTVQR